MLLSYLINNFRKGMANTHFIYLRKKIAACRKNEFLLDAQLLSKQNPVPLHKVILAVFSSHIREENKGVKGQWEVSARGYTQAEIENLVDFLYNEDVEVGNRITEVIKSVKLDLVVDQRIHKKRCQRTQCNM